MKALLSYVNKSGIIMPKYKTEINKIAEKYIIGTKADEKYYQVGFAQSGRPERIGNLSISPEIELLDYDFDSEVADFKITLGDTKRSCRIEKYRWQGVTYYLLDIEGRFDQENVFDRLEIEQDCAAFNLAVMESLKNGLDFLPTIFHCNDYQTALTPFLRKIKFANRYPDLKTVYTIHFYSYRGIFSKEKVLTIWESAKKDAIIVWYVGKIATACLTL